DRSWGQQVAELVKAQVVIWGSLAHDRKGWSATANVLRPGEGGPLASAKAVSTNLYQVSAELADLILQTLHVTPSEAERGEMRRQWTSSPAALAAYWEGNYARAVQADGGFAEAYSSLASVLGNQGKWEEAEARARDALKLKPTDARAHAVLGASLWISRHDTE